MSTEIKKIDVSNLDISNIEFVGFEEMKIQQLKLVTDNPYIEVIDSKTYEEGKKRRTALRGGRTSIQNQDKSIASNVAAIRKLVKEKHDILIEIVSIPETTQQDTVSKYEAVLEEKKQEKERLENERILKIKTYIDEFESKCYDIIKTANIENVNDIKSELDVLVLSDYDVMEFDYSYSMAKQRIQSVFDEKCSSIQNKENERLENERLRAEKEESDRKYQELQKKENERIKKAENERLELEAKQNIEKEAILNVRINRLLEIGFEFKEDNNYYSARKIKQVLYKKKISEFGVIAFEDFLNNLKKEISNYDLEIIELNKKHEALEKELKIKEQQKLKESKERIKRLKSDKLDLNKAMNILKDSFITEIAFREFKNEESESLRKKIQKSFDTLFEECLTEINNL